MDKSTDVLKSPWTQRPRRIVLDNGLLWLSTNWIEMNGFPPTPPRTGRTSAAIAVFFIMFFRIGPALDFPISFNSFERAERLREIQRDLGGLLQIFRRVCVGDI